MRRTPSRCSAIPRARHRPVKSRGGGRTAELAMRRPGAAACRAAVPVLAAGEESAEEPRVPAGARPPARLLPPAAAVASTPAAAARYATAASKQRTPALGRRRMRAAAAGVEQRRRAMVRRTPGCSSRCRWGWRGFDVERAGVLSEVAEPPRAERDHQFRKGRVGHLGNAEGKYVCVRYVRAFLSPTRTCIRRTNAPGLRDPGAARYSALFALLSARSSRR